MGASSIMSALLGGVTLNFSLAVGGLAYPDVSIGLNSVEINKPAIHLYGTELLALNGKAFEWFYQGNIEKEEGLSRPIPSTDLVFACEQYWDQYISALYRRYWLVRNLENLTAPDSSITDEEVVAELKRVAKWFNVDSVFGGTNYVQFRRDLLERVWRDEVRYLDNELLLIETWLKMYISYFVLYDKTGEDRVSDLNACFVDEYKYRVSQRMSNTMK